MVDTDFLNRARNEVMARRELSAQSRALLILRPLETLLHGQLRRGYSDQEVDVLSAIMWLFDAMMYYESRSDRPGITRLEAEHLLMMHLQEAYPGWPPERYEQFSSTLFSALTPANGFCYQYYDFTQQTLREETFRYISWHSAPSGDVRLFNLTDEGIVLYTTRLDESAIDRAEINARRAQRTLRRGEIAIAIDHVRSTRMQLDNFMTRIQVGLRAVRAGNIQYSFVEDMLPLLDEAYEILSDITDRLAESLNEIVRLRSETRPDLNTVEQLREAEAAFQEVVNHCRKFRGDIGDVIPEFIALRLNIIAKREQNLFSQTLEEAVLRPLLMLPAPTGDAMEALVQAALPAYALAGYDDDLVCLDLGHILARYSERFDQEDEAAALDDLDDAETQAMLEQSLPQAAIDAGYDWVDERLQQAGSIAFSEAIRAYEEGDIESLNALRAILIVIGGYAASDDPSYQVTLGAQLNHPLFEGDDLRLHFMNSNKEVAGEYARAQ